MEHLSQLVDRPIDHGDYLQVGHTATAVLHTAASEVMDQLHNLEAYGWPIEARTRNNEGSFVARIRERRRRLRVWLPTEALCTILGPTHGPVRFRLEYESVPSVAELRLELNPSAGLQLVVSFIGAHRATCSGVGLVRFDRSQF